MSVSAVSAKTRSAPTSEMPEPSAVTNAVSQPGLSRPSASLLAGGPVAAPSQSGSAAKSSDERPSAASQAPASASKDAGDAAASKQEDASKKPEAAPDPVEPEIGVGGIGETEREDFRFPCREARSGRDRIGVAETVAEREGG